MSTRESFDYLKPTSRLNVRDALEQANFDVVFWPKEKPAHPRFCYRWAFVQPGHAVALMIWYTQLQQGPEDIRVNLNVRDVWKRRPSLRRKCQDFEDAVAQSRSKKLPVRVIINAGTMGIDRGSSSQVKLRMLDPCRWRADSFDPYTGDMVLVRENSENLEE
jgi:5-methylcytosine-specific restriction protein A